MAFLNLFKKKGKGADRVEQKKPAIKKQPVKTIKKTAKPAALKVGEKPVDSKAKPKVKPLKKKLSQIGPKVLRSPHITEKATRLEDNNDYVFKVSLESVKSEIKKAVEEFYGVKVLKVRTINIPKKLKRLGKNKGFKQGYKKAIVRVKKGQTIELMPR